MDEQRIEELAAQATRRNSDYFRNEDAKQAIRTAVNEALTDAAERVNILYTNPPEDYAKFDLRQGWDYALDLAEQLINSLKLP